MPQSTRDELKARKAVVASMLLKGHTHQEIAGQVNVSRSQVTKDVATIRDRWESDALQDYTQHIAQELQRLDLIMSTAWEAWETSKGENGDQPGNPSFLNIVLKAHERVCVLRGLDASHKIEINARGGIKSPMMHRGSETW